MDAVTTTAAPETRLHVLDYWRVIRVRKTVILAVFLLVVLTTTLVTFIVPEQFSSTVQMEVNKDASDLPVFSQQPYFSGSDPYFMQNEFQKIRSREVLYRVITNLNLNQMVTEDLKSTTPLRTTQTYQWLRGRMDVVPVRNTSLIEVTVFHENPQIAANIANEIARVYKDWRLEIRRNWTTNAISSLEMDLVRKDEEVKEAAERVDALRRTNQVTDLLALDRGATTLDTELMRHIAAARTPKVEEYTQITTLLEQLNKLSKADFRKAISTVSPEATSYQGLPELFGQLSLAEQKYAQVQKEYGTNHVEYAKAKTMVDTIDAQIDSKVEGIRLGLESKAAALKQALAALEKELDDAKLKDRELAERVRPYQMAKEDLAWKRDTRAALSMKIDQAKIDLNIPKNAIVTVVTRAEPGILPVRPKKALYIAISVIVGLVVGIGLAFFIEYLDTSVKTIDDVERALQSPVLGVVPQNVGIMLDEGPEGPHAEAYRVLRTNLLFARKEETWNTLTVVSAGAGEGKSTTLFNLATVFAQHGDRVLIVDSDLRRPSLHKLLKLSNSTGLTNVLLKQSTLDQVIQKTSLATLDFIPSGRLPSSSMGILNSTQMRDLVRELKQRYDFIFFDSPPIMGVSDASILASEVDMAVQVIQYRRYPQLMTIRAKQMIEKVGGRLLGLVLNNINVAQDESYYYYSGYHYDYYYSRRAGDDEDDDSAKVARQKGDRESKVDLKSKY
jgi:capsular exopolysaccharide synthesis family protein